MLAIIIVLITHSCLLFHNKELVLKDVLFAAIAQERMTNSCGMLNLLLECLSSLLLRFQEAIRNCS